MSIMLWIGFAVAGGVRGRIIGDGEIGPAVVWVEGLSGGQVSKQNTEITHVSGQFQPYVSIGFVGNSFIFRNEDDTLHNTHLYLRLGYQKAISQRPLHYGATLYNVALPKGSDEVKRPIKPYHRYRDDTGFIEVVCNPHPGERAYVLVFDHPYAAVTEKDGTFSIRDVPEGKHEVRIWHSSAVQHWGYVEVKDGASTDVVIELE